MPHVYLIVRFTTKTHDKPAYSTTDVTMKGISRALYDDASRRFTAYEVDNEDPQNGQPARYLIAVDVDRHAVDEVKVSYGTTHYEDTKFRFHRLPKQIKESDKERLKWEGHTNDKAVIRLEGETGIRVKMRSNSFLWYELVTIDTYAYEEWITEGEENEKAKELWRLNLESAGGEDADMLDDVEESSP